MYLESHGKLRTLYTPRDGKHKASHRCFYATTDTAAAATAATVSDTAATTALIDRQPAALYIEAEEQPILGEHRDVKLQYDLEVRRRRRWRPQRRRRRQQINDDPEGRYRLYNEEEEEDCRPCSLEELAKAYCQSDLVARGTVNAVERQLNLEATELIVGVTKTLRRIEENEVHYHDIFIIFFFCLVSFLRVFAAANKTDSLFFGLLLLSFSNRGATMRTSQSSTIEKKFVSGYQVSAMHDTAKVSL